jgi:hypothetical protein
VIRDIDETSAKPEVDTETELVPVALQQVAAVETGIPNVVLAQDTIGSLVETDLRLALNEGLDELVLLAVEDSSVLDAGSDRFSSASEGRSPPSSAPATRRTP